MIPASWLLLPILLLDGGPLVIVVGAGGTPEYEQQFDQWADQWQVAAIQGGRFPHRIDPGDDQKTRLLERLAELQTDDVQPGWLILIGHGTFDGQTARFNLTGPDITPAELDQAVTQSGGEWVILHTTAASGAFLAPLSASGRVVVTATRSGSELSVTRLGGELIAAFQDNAADLNQDEQVSLLEAFLTSSRKVTASYESEKRLVTEHALIDDNGDGLGTPADFYEGLDLVKSPQGDAQPDGLRARQLHLIPSVWEQAQPSSWRAQRDALERELEQLKRRRESLPADEYDQQRRRLIHALADLYREARARMASDDATSATQ